MIKKTFWNGLKIFVPIAMTIAIVIWIFTTIETFFGHFLKHIIPAEYYFDGLGIIVGIAFIFAIGLLVKSWVVRQLYHMADRIVKKIPFIKTIYNAIQDLFNYFDHSHSKAQQAVLLQTTLGKVVGFITCDNLTKLNPSLGNDQEVLVYVPLSYQIGGMMLVVSRHELTPLDWSVNEAMSFIITAGMTGGKNV